MRKSQYSSSFCQDSKSKRKVRTQSTNSSICCGLIKQKTVKRIEDYSYMEEDLIGEGYTSKVYLANHVDDPGQKYALKVIDKRNIKNDHDNLLLLKQEIQIHRRLDHPNIVKCYAVYEQNHFYFLVLEYCPHGDLDNFIKKRQVLDEELVLTITKQIQAGYAYLIQQKVIHRDIKPPNILKKGTVWKICDFGFAIQGKKMFVAQLNVGTPFYMAPQALERSYYSAKTDFFAIGVLVHEMLFGKTPWTHKNETVLLKQMLAKGITNQSLETIRNENLKVFLLKVCESNQRKRMSIDDFINFDFDREIENKSWLGLKSCLSVQKISRTTRTTQSHNSRDKSKTTLDQTNDGQEKSQFDYHANCNDRKIKEQLQMCELILNLIKNQKHFRFEVPSEKELMLIVLSKHANYVLRRITNIKFNNLQLEEWESFAKSKQFAFYCESARLLQNLIEQIIAVEVNKRSIVAIRQVNKKFDELNYEMSLSSKCKTHLKGLVKQIMKGVEQQIQLGGDKCCFQLYSYLQLYYGLIGQNENTCEDSSLTQQTQKQIDAKISFLENYEESILSAQDFAEMKSHFDLKIA